MRQIKFRGKDIKTGEWLYGDLVHAADGERTAILVSDRECYDECEADPSTIGQYTGLLDRNGKGIYEGDLIKDKEFTYEVYYFEEIGAFMVEEYKSDCDSPKIFLCSDVSKESEIIGNIHDNPDLLKSE